MNSLQEIPGWIWKEWGAAAGAIDHPFRLPALATSGAEGPSVRLVVLRSVRPELRELEVHTDRRSRKVAETGAAGARLQLLCYDPARRIQVAASGSARLESDARKLEEAWRRTPVPSRMAYAARVPPGTPVGDPAGAFTPETLAMTVEATEPARANFSILVACLDTLEWLELEAPFHRRARFEWTGAGWCGSWIAP